MNLERAAQPAPSLPPTQPSPVTSHPPVNEREQTMQPEHKGTVTVPLGGVRKERCVWSLRMNADIRF